VRSTLIFLSVATIGTVAALVFGPLWLVGVLIAGLTITLVTADRDRRAHRIAVFEQTRVSLVDSNRLAVGLLFSTSGELLRVSDSLSSTLGWQYDDFVGLRTDEFVDPEHLPLVLDAFDAVRLVPLGQASVNVRVRTPEAWLAMEVSVTNATEIEALGGFVIQLQNIDDQLGYQQRIDTQTSAMVALNALIGQALDDSDDSTLVQAAVTKARTALGLDAVELYRSVNGALELAAGVGPGGLTLDRRSEIVTGDSLAGRAISTGVAVWEPPRASAQAQAAGQAHTGLALPVGGSTSPAALVVRSSHCRVFDHGDVAFLASVVGLIALARRQRGAEQDAFRMSRTDELTGLVNREAFLKRLRTSLTQCAVPGEMVGVLLVDLDHFKIINDSLGHTAGDALIEALSHRLSGGLRPGDTLARFGGDESVILTRGLGSAAQATLAARRVQSVLFDTFNIAGHDVQVTASVGVAVFDDPEVDPGTLMQHADAALARAKELGRERVEMFDPTMLEEAVTRLRTEEELRTALVDEQLRLFYQSTVDLATGQTRAVEALVRWIHPGRGLVTPAEFIPISEATGLIEEIGAWVINESCRQAAVWMKEGNATQVSVNISGRQLADPMLIQTIEAALDRHNLPAEYFAIELTETALVAGVTTALETLRELHDRGVTIAIDDFGTGHSLSYLKTLPVDLVKIDRAFVTGIDRSGDDYAIISAMIKLAQTMGKQVVAQGVETEQQLELLRDLGCDLAQGFLFSPAVFEIDHGSEGRPWTDLVIEARR
jgi:diguanylate cyclase (GGDEF)-like protein